MKKVEVQLAEETRRAAESLELETTSGLEQLKRVYAHLCGVENREELEEDEAVGEHGASIHDLHWQVVSDAGKALFVQVIEAII